MDQIKLRYLELVDDVNSVIHPVIVPLSENTSEVVSNASPPEFSVPVPAASPLRLSVSPKSVPVTTPLCRSSRVSKHPNRMDL